jgi:hypothetical protein
MKITILLLILFFIYPLNAEGPFFDLEMGAVFTGRNDVKIPSRYGTNFSLRGSLHSPPEFFYRTKVGAAGKRYAVYFLNAPLDIEARGQTSRFINFNNCIYPPGFKLKSHFVFNSYRLTYRYNIIADKNIALGLGLTAKLREAHISMETLGISRRRRDVGFVPLVNISLTLKLDKKLSLAIDADALAAPQGRAEDVSTAIQLHLTKNLTYRIGYRMLEGGAKNSSVYTFSMFHYALFGLTLTY